MHVSEQDIYERYLERAAIMEYDGELPAARASQLVYNLVGKWCKAKGIRFPQQIRDDFVKQFMTNKQTEEGTTAK